MIRMEELTQTQVILLTLLVSFVTSIATGIITTSLLAQAPASVTQTINRVVEHTIEKVVPAPSGGTVKDVTVVNEEDAILGSIDKATSALVRIKGVGSDGSEVFYALGTIVSKDGLVISNAHSLALGSIYSVYLADGAKLQAIPVTTDDTNHLALFKITSDNTHKEFNFVTIAQNGPQLGQSVVAVEGESKNRVAVGRVLSTNDRTEAGTTAGSQTKVTYSVETDISPVSETEGGPILNLSGELIGIKALNDDLTLSSGVYITVTPLTRLLKKAP